MIEYINIEDVRVGNTLAFYRPKSDGNTLYTTDKIKSVYFNDDIDDYCFELEYSKQHINIKGFEGVELTTDILIEYGFTQMYDIDKCKIGLMLYISNTLRIEYSSYPGGNSFNLCLINDSNGLFSDIPIYKEIKFLHQLENMYFNISGKQLLKKE